MLPIAVIVADRLVEHREKNPIFTVWTKILVLLVVQKKKKPKFWIKGAEMLLCVWEVQPYPGVAD